MVSETHLNERYSVENFCTQLTEGIMQGMVVLLLLIVEVYSGKTCQFVVVKIETHNQPLILATAYRTVLLMKYLVFVKN